MARTEPARPPRDARLRRRPPLARSAEERSRLDPLHRRDANRARLRRLLSEGNARCAQTQGGAKLPGHVHWRAPLCPAYLREYAERADEKARLTVHDQQRMSVVPRQAPEKGSPLGDFRGLRYWRVGATSARTPRRDPGAGSARRVARFR